MFNMHTLFSDTNLISDFSQFPKNSQGAENIREEIKKDQRLDSSSSKVVLFHGGCVV